MLIGLSLWSVRHLMAIHEQASGLVYQLKITLLEVEPSIWRHSAVRLESALAKWRVLLSECDGIENRTHPY